MMTLYASRAATSAIKYGMLSRLVKGWEVDPAKPQPDLPKRGIEWFEAELRRTIEVDDLMGKFRISEALMAVYKLFWDEFSSWYLEVIKPAYGSPIDGETYNETLRFFDTPPPPAPSLHALYHRRALAASLRPQRW